MSASRFDGYPVTGEIEGHVGPVGQSIEEAFLEFHELNPHVYRELVRMARQLRSRGINRIGIGMLFEVLRWKHALRTNSLDFKLNNNFRSYYARLIMMSEEDLAGVFETRRLHVQP